MLLQRNIRQCNAPADDAAAGHAIAGDSIEQGNKPFPVTPHSVTAAPVCTATSPTTKHGFLERVAYQHMQPPPPPRNLQEPVGVIRLPQVRRPLHLLPLLCGGRVGPQRGDLEAGGAAAAASVACDQHAKKG